MSKQEQAILILNSQIKATVGVSKIHGVGVVSIRHLQKGDKVYANALPRVIRIPYGSIGKLFPEVRKVILDRWPLVYHGEPFVMHDIRLLSLMNHSYTPNYNPVTDEALENISVGEEITENYCIVKDAEKIYTWLDCKENEPVRLSNMKKICLYIKNMLSLRS